MDYSFDRKEALYEGAWSEPIAAAYGWMIPSAYTEVIVLYRTGHQASQTRFALKRLLGYPSVL